MTSKRGYGSNPELARESAYKAQEAWRLNGKKPRGYALNPELARQARLKGLAKIRENQAKKKLDQA